MRTFLTAYNNYSLMEINVDLFYFITLISTTPFGTLIPLGVVPNTLHTCCAFKVAHLYNAGVFRSTNKGIPANFLEMSKNGNF